MISLTERLKAAAELVPQGVSVIDIGTDHARLPIYLLLSGKSPRVCAADINRGPLSRAEENARRYGAAVDTLLSDGFSGVTERFGCACICGMGGELISSIIGAAGGILPPVLVLQPMSAAEKLRKYLWDGGFSVTAELFVCEGKRPYTVMRAENTGVPEGYSYSDLYLGKSRPDCDGYRAYRAKVCAAAGKRLAGAAAEGRNCDCDKELVEICSGESDR